MFPVHIHLYSDSSHGNPTAVNCKEDPDQAIIFLLVGNSSIVHNSLTY